MALIDDFKAQAQVRLAQGYTADQLAEYARTILGLDDAAINYALGISSVRPGDAATNKDILDAIKAEAIKAATPKPTEATAGTTSTVSAPTAGTTSTVSAPAVDTTPKIKEDVPEGYFLNPVQSSGSLSQISGALEEGKFLPVLKDADWYAAQDLLGRQKNPNTTWRDPISGYGISVETKNPDDPTSQIVGFKYYDPQGRTLRSSIFTPAELYRNANEFGIDLGQISELGRKLDAANVNYRPGELYPGTGSDLGINFANVANTFNIAKNEAVSNAVKNTYAPALTATELAANALATRTGDDPARVLALLTSGVTAEQYLANNATEQANIEFAKGEKQAQINYENMLREAASAAAGGASTTGPNLGGAGSFIDPIAYVLPTDVAPITAEDIAKRYNAQLDVSKFTPTTYGVEPLTTSAEYDARIAAAAKPSTGTNTGLSGLSRLSALANATQTQTQIQNQGTQQPSTGRVDFSKLPPQLRMAGQ